MELTVNLGLVLTKLDTEHGLAQPQLVTFFPHLCFSCLIFVACLLADLRKKSWSADLSLASAAPAKFNFHMILLR